VYSTWRKRIVTFKRIISQVDLEQNRNTR